MTKRKIYIIGDITNDSYKEFVEELEELEKSTGDIYIDLSSDGGDAYSALAFFDRIRESRNNIIITARGLVASAAVLILAAGDKRYMSRNAWLMVHEDTVAISEDARVAEVEKDVAHSRALEDQWCKLLQEVTGTTHRIWSDLHRKETFLTSVQCLKLKLIEGII